MDKTLQFAVVMPVSYQRVDGTDSHAGCICLACTQIDHHRALSCFQGQGQSVICLAKLPATDLTSLHPTSTNSSPSNLTPDQHSTLEHPAIGLFLRLNQSKIATIAKPTLCEQLNDEHDSATTPTQPASSRRARSKSLFVSANSKSLIL